MSSALIILTVQSVTLNATAVEKSNRAAFDVTAKADLPDGTIMMLEVYYESGASANRLGYERAAVAEGKFTARVTLGSLPPVPGRFRIEAFPDNVQSHPLPPSVIRMLDEYRATTHVSVGQPADVEKLRNQLAVDLSDAIQACSRGLDDLRGAAKSAVGAEWARRLEAQQKQLHEIGAAAVSRREYALFGYDAVAAMAFEHLSMMSDTLRQAMQQSVEAGKEDPGVEKLFDVLHRERDGYLALLDPQVREPARGAETVRALRAALAAASRGDVPAAVQRHLMELGWQFPRDMEDVQRLSELVQRIYRGEAAAADAEPILAKLEKRVP